MTKGTSKHLNLEQRFVIEEGLREGESCRTIAKKIGVSPSTVSREVQVNRVGKEIKSRRPLKLSLRCTHFPDCEKVGQACPKCSSLFVRCRDCRTRHCIHSCPDFERKQCPWTSKWPYVCPPHCRKRGGCNYPKYRYRASEAHAQAQTRLSESRRGIDISEEELCALNELVAPLIKQGQSFEAIWATHQEELPICVRSAYNYQENSLLTCLNAELPRKVRLRPRKRFVPSQSKRSKIDRQGKEFSDFLALPIELQARVVQGDSVCGFQDNKLDILSLHFVARGFQSYQLKGHGVARETIRCLNEWEQAFGSPEAFRAAIPVLLVDRGAEFDDWEGMERSCISPEIKRTQVFYCDTMQSNQKANAERNHEQLRRILVKNRSNFDALSIEDVRLCTNHVNSYSIERFENCAFDQMVGLVGTKVLTKMGFEQLVPDEVILKPYLLPDVVEQ